MVNRFPPRLAQFYSSRKSLCMGKGNKCFTLHNIKSNLFQTNTIYTLTTPFSGQFQKFPSEFQIIQVNFRYRTFQLHFRIVHRPFHLTCAIAHVSTHANVSAIAICRTHEKSYSAEKVLLIEYSSFNPSLMFTSTIFE